MGKVLEMKIFNKSPLERRGLEPDYIERCNLFEVKFGDFVDFISNLSKETLPKYHEMKIIDKPFIILNLYQSITNNLIYSIPVALSEREKIERALTLIYKNTYV